MLNSVNMNSWWDAHASSSFEGVVTEYVRLRRLYKDDLDYKIINLYNGESYDEAALDAIGLAG